MHKLGSLTAYVLTSWLELKIPWIEASDPFRRQLLNTLHANNCFAQSSAGRLSGDGLVLPEMDDWILGLKTASIFDCPSQSSSDPSMAIIVLAQVHTVLLMDDSESMLQCGTANSVFRSHRRLNQAHTLTSDLAPIIARYDSQGMDMHF